MSLQINGNQILIPFFSLVRNNNTYNTHTPTHTHTCARGENRKKGTQTLSLVFNVSTKSTEKINWPTNIILLLCAKKHFNFYWISLFCVWRGIKKTFSNHFQTFQVQHANETYWNNISSEFQTRMQIKMCIRFFSISMNACSVLKIERNMIKKDKQNPTAFFDVWYGSSLKATAQLGVEWSEATSSLSLLPPL